MYKNFFDGFEAIIFDLDGTVVRDEFVWDLSLENVFAKEIISDEPYYGERGQNLSFKIDLILARNTFRTNIAGISYYKMVVGEFFNNIDKVEVTPGFYEFAEYLKSKGKKLILVTNSDEEVTNGILDKLKLKKYFDLVINVDEDLLPKPAPDIYRLALKKLNLPSSKVLVFEDSVNGARAAEIAEIKTIIIQPDEISSVEYGSKNRIFTEDFNTINENIDQDADNYLINFFSK